MNTSDIDALFEELSRLEQVEAIALGGSRAGKDYDRKSDYDVYLYCTAPVSEQTRRTILQKYCSVMELGNHFWEYEDNCRLLDGTDIDILYRDLDGIVREVAEVVEKGCPHNGYTTCIWHNLITSGIIYDRSGRLRQAQQRFRVPYPTALKNNIIDRSMKLLSESMPAYRDQISKAAQRRDIISLNHRTAAFMEAYFDALLALNELTHPGEKRLIPFCKANCRILPRHFEENLERLFSDLFSDPAKAVDDIDEIITELKNIL